MGDGLHSGRIPKSKKEKKRPVGAVYPKLYTPIITPGTKQKAPQSALLCTRPLLLGLDIYIYMYMYIIYVYR